MVLDPFPIKSIDFELKMGFKGCQWVDMVGGIILGVVFGIEPQHKSLWRRSPAGIFFFQTKTRSWIFGTCFKENGQKMKEQTLNNIPIPIRIPQK